MNHPENTPENKASQEQSPTQAAIATPPAIEAPTMPGIEVPKGGGAIQSIGETFTANPATGTGSFSVPIAMSPGRAGFAPGLQLSYNSGSGNSPFGLGWSLGVAGISRKTAGQLPTYSEAHAALPVSSVNKRYQSSNEALQGGDVFLLSGAEDLVPALKEEAGEWLPDAYTGNGYHITRYRPRTEGGFARIEKWVRTSDGDTHWRTTTRDNVHSVFGETDAARVLHPENPRHVFEWKIERSWNEKGHLMHFHYKRENAEGLHASAMHEAHRLAAANAFNALYLKRVEYGNSAMYDGRTNTFAGPNSWLFELVLDYGEHHQDNPLPSDVGTWLMRQDPFSTYRPGFDLRTYRLCRRILMFHRFPELNNGADTLVKSTVLTYDENPTATRLVSVAHWAHKVGEEPAPLPAIDMTYSTATLDTTLRDFNPEDLENLPAGAGSKAWQWRDLDGEGLTGILTEAAEGWYYKRNNGDERYYQPTDFSGSSTPEIRLGALEKVASRPAGSLPQQLADIDGDGQQEVVVRTPQLSGYYARISDISAEPDSATAYEPFVPFEQTPNINWNDPNLRMIDLTGSGRADLLLTSDHAFCWYPGNGKKGYVSNLELARFMDEADGPTRVHSMPVPAADGQSASSAADIYLADMTGDGLTDLVRITNGSVSYWPNMGYGRFGARVNMSNTPMFDRQEQFDHQRLRLADVDGSGTADLLYFGTDAVHWWGNQSGNGYSLQATIDNFPRTNNLSSMSVLDLLGNGTGCLVWSSPLPGDVPFRVRYLQLQTQKPYLLTQVNNNMGKLSRMHYAPSTKFYLNDRREGRPWLSKLPFPVHVVERTEILDEITQTRFVSLYAYHHGHYDGVEREFRGFGMVEQWDTEHYDAFAQPGLFEPGTNLLDEPSHIPPVHTKTWLHTGWYQDAQKIHAHYQTEFFQGDAEAFTLPATALPAGLPAGQEREAVRTLRGKPLRVEVYADDGTEKAGIPFSVSDSTYSVELIQPLAGNRNAVFLCTPSESLNTHYERAVTDPRVAHSLVLERDAFGHAIASASVAYPRRGAGHADEQSTLRVTYSEVDMVHDIIQNYQYRVGVPVETRQFELHGLAMPGNGPFAVDDLRAVIHAAIPISFETDPGAQLSKRLLANARAVYYNNELTGPDVLGGFGDVLLFHHAENMSFTQGQVNGVFNGSGGQRVTDAMLETDAKFHKEGDAWWTHSPVVSYHSGAFYLPVITEDAFGNTTTLAYDLHHLLPIRVTDALGNSTMSHDIDYRVLAPTRVEDPNSNQTLVAFDVRGMAVKTAVQGKTGEGVGDTLQSPTSTVEYELFNWRNYRKPNYVRSLAREQHGDPNSPWQETYTYTGGMGQELLTKVQAEPGDAFLRNSDGTLQLDGEGQPIAGHVAQRWLGNGRIIINNKGLAVKQYEPYFSSTHEFEDEAELREYGVTPVLHYDSLGRNVCTELPDGTFTKVEFDVWQSREYDQNDTVLDSQWYVDRNSPDPAGEGSFEWAERSAWLSTRHHDTPKITDLDVLGRPYLTQADAGTYNPDTQAADHNYFDTRLVQDVQGNKLKVVDARGNETTFVPDMAGGVLHTVAPDAGWRSILSNAIGNPIFAWDERGNAFRTTYDALHRPVGSYVIEAPENPGDPVGPELLVGWVVYGDGGAVATPELQNLRGKAIRTFDQSGCLRANAFDFKGNPLQSTRYFAKNYHTTVDWSAVANAGNISDIDAASPFYLESEDHATTTTYDALNRATLMQLPDGSNVRPSYNPRNLLNGLEAQLRNSTDWTPFVNTITYDARGQRQHISYSNGTQTSYSYEPTTFRLLRLMTNRLSDGKSLQDLNYYYDPVGNITAVEDNAHQEVYFNNITVAPLFLYEYDALYRLTFAYGREHMGENTSNSGSAGHNDFPALTPVPQANNASALRPYAQHFSYDAVGNILELMHTANLGNYTRTYQYSPTSNRLQSTTQGDATIAYPHDVHGNITAMPHLQAMKWDYANQLREVDLGGGGTAYYVYSGGQRTRKVIETGNVVKDRLYLGPTEIYRKTVSGTLDLERETLHLSDDAGRLCTVETLTVNSAAPVASPTSDFRWQYGNHLGSASLELDETGAVISYEEYHAFGTSAYRTGRSQAEVSLKRYRYTGKERDEESGLYYYGARYYAAWLGRFTSVDPLKDKYPHLNTYHYAANNPVTLKDIDGMQLGDDSDADAPAFSLASTIDLSGNTPSDYRGAMAAGIGDAFIQSGQDLAGMAELSYAFTLGQFTEGGAQIRSEFYQQAAALMTMLQDETQRDQLIAAIGADIIESLEHFSGQGTMGEVGYEHGLLLGNAMLAIMGAKLAGTLKKAVPAGGVSKPKSTGSIWNTLNIALQLSKKPSFDPDLDFVRPDIITEVAANQRTLSRALDSGDVVPKAVPDYSPRIRQRAVEDPVGHNFPFSFDEVILNTKPTDLGDGALGYALRGSYNNKDVIYNMIVEDGVITHRDMIKAKNWKQRSKSFRWAINLEDIPTTPKQ